MSAAIVENYGTAQIRYSGIRLPTLEADMGDAQAATLNELAGFWRETYGPRHFRREAFNAYSGFQSDHIYSRRVSRGPDADPLVSRFGNRPSRSRRHGGWSNDAHPPGNLRKAFLKGTMVLRQTGSGESRTLRVTWPGLPRYVYVDRHGPKRAQGPRKYLELTMTNQQEAAALSAEFARRFEIHLQKRET